MDRTQLQQLGLSPTRHFGLTGLHGGYHANLAAFWLSPTNDVVYNLAVQSPQYAVDSLDALLRTPVRGAAAAATTAPQLLSNLVGVAPTAQVSVASRYNLAPAIDVYVGVQRPRSRQCRHGHQTACGDLDGHLPRGVSVDLLGQAQTMKASFVELGVGLVMAIVMVYLLIVVNFQSWWMPLSSLPRCPPP